MPFLIEPGHQETQTWLVIHITRSITLIAMSNEERVRYIHTRHKTIYLYTSIHFANIIVTYRSYKIIERYVRTSLGLDVSSTHYPNSQHSTEIFIVCSSRGETKGKRDYT